MEREKILLKIRDYNNELEKIIEKKSFSENTKNLLLSMLYKIETAYSDYTTVKRQTLNKNDYLETILLTVLQDCSIIHLVKPGMEEAKELEESNKKCIVNQEKNELFVYQNETSILQAILEIGECEKKYKVEEEFFRKPVEDFFKLGKIQEMLEVIKDFNGWSWNISKDTQNGEIARICYLNLINLVGIDIVIKMEQEKNCIIFIYQKLNNLYGEKLAKEFMVCFLQNVLKIYAQKDEEYKKEIAQKRKYWKEQLEEIQNKAKYLEKLTKEKIELISRVGQIDMILNNNVLLKENYKNANKDLPMEKKHFSVSTYAETLEKERNEILEKRKEINKLFEPEKFIEKRNWIEEREAFYQEINFDNSEKEELLEKLQEIFLKLMEQKIKKVEDKKDILNQIYELRYYFIQIKERGLFKEQKEKQNKIKKQILKKAIEEKVCNPISKEEDLNENILSVLFDLKIVNLENIYLQIEEEETGTKVEVYDEKILEDTIILEKLNWKEKSKKKRKIFD